jgi:hypothetical protein
MASFIGSLKACNGQEKVSRIATTKLGGLTRLCSSEIRSASTRLQHQPAFRFSTPSLRGARRHSHRAPGSVGGHVGERPLDESAAPR